VYSGPLVSFVSDQVSYLRCDLDPSVLDFTSDDKNPVIVQPVYDDFNRLLFLHDHREAPTLTNELPKELDQFRFLRDTISFMFCLRVTCWMSIQEICRFLYSF
jgi:hypothetical protein